LPIPWNDTIFLAANNPFLVYMVLVHLSPADIQGIGLTLAGFDANRQLKACQATDLEHFHGLYSSASWETCVAIVSNLL
jgi:hypothetical protein